MRVLELFLGALLLAACARDFGAMSQQQRLEIGSARLAQACIESSDAHGPGFLGSLQIYLGREYFDYMAENVRPGELDQYIDRDALQMCLDTEGWRGRLQQLILRVGSDQHVEAVVRSVASPGLWCDGGFTRHFERHEAERLVAACNRLGLRQNSP